MKCARIAPPFAFCFLLMIASCGGTSPALAPKLSGSTSVAIQLSSTSNDQFVHFNTTIEQLSLINEAGKATTIFNIPTDVDFIPFNVGASPFATVTVPQDVYTSATLTLSNPRFSYVSMDSQGMIYFATDAYGELPEPPVVILPNPITVSGPAMGLTVDLQVAQSGSFIGFPPNQMSYSITPTFKLRSFPIPMTGVASGPGVAAQVTAVDLVASTITVTLAGHPSVQNQSFKIAVNSSTEFLAGGSLGNLAPGSLVNLDLALLPDATFSAARIEVVDTAATNLISGQLVAVAPLLNYISSIATEQQGQYLSVQPVGMGYPYVYDDSTRFQTSVRFPYLSRVPFPATFDASTLAPGQRVSVGSTSISVRGGIYTAPTTVTLVPQTIHAVVTGVSNIDDYAVYNVALASYDPIPQLNGTGVPPTFTRMLDAEHVTVYVEPHASLFNSDPLTVGGTFRFSGLLFNDAGVFRLICDRVDDGVSP